MTSPLALVPRAHQVVRLMVALTNLTLPSAKADVDAAGVEARRST